MAESATPKARKTAPVAYEVYRVGQGVLQFVGPTEAINDTKAIQAVLGERPQAGQYVAIPLRSLRVREVGLQTHTKLVIK